MIRFKAVEITDNFRMSFLQFRPNVSWIGNFAGDCIEIVN